MGLYALSYNTGGYSTSIGYQALKNNIGAYSTSIGANAGLDNIAANIVAVGREALSQNTGANNIEVGYYGTSGINKIQLVAGTWAAATSGAGTTVDASRKYRIAAVIGGVETELSTTITGTGAAGAQYDHTNVPVYSGPKTCTARNIYRYKSADKKWYLVGAIADNATTTYTDTQATASYGSANASPSNTIAIGNEAKILTSNDAVIGNSANPISRLYLGGVYHSTSGQAGLDFTLRGMGGNGTDKDGGDVVISGGASTGTGTEGKIQFFTSRPSSTAATENVPASRVEITHTGITSTMINNADSGTDEIDSVTFAGGYGIIIACSTTDGTSAVWKLKGTTFEAIEVDADWTATKDGAATYNVYIETGAIKLQNKVGDDKAVKLGYFGI
jgi:hypothetical protein